MRIVTTGTQDQVSIVLGALARCTYPFSSCDPDRVIPVEWADLSRFRQTEHGVATLHGPDLEGAGLVDTALHYLPVDGTPHSHHHGAPGGADPLEWRGRVLGLAYYSGKIVLDTSLEDDPEFAGEVFLSELAHMIDFFCMTDRDRVEIWNAVHAGTDRDLSDSVDVEDAVDLGHGHSWFDIGDYYSWVGEAWMGLFVRAWSDFDVTIDFPDHPPTDEAIAQVRAWFTPWVEPEEPVEPGTPPAGCLAPVRRFLGRSWAAILRWSIR